ncbi:acetyltransferase [uncultured Nostoc sp.]|uniref:acetyltransferase n=1 Tax=uncultured Nostoc sp. TaxID=340711 RepID=UPI0035CB6157
MLNTSKKLIALAALIPTLVSGMPVKANIQGCNPTRSNRSVCPSTATPEIASFIDPTAIIFEADNITLAKQVYIGPFAKLIASYDAGITIDAESNVQDNVTIIGKFERDEHVKQKVRLLGIKGVKIADHVIMAHGVTIKGPAQIGIGGTNIDVNPNKDQEVFLGFGSEVDGAILQKNTGVSTLGRVGSGVTLKSGYIVLPGKNVTTQAQADDPALGKVRLLTEADIAFNEAVLEVNIAFAREYTKLARKNASNVRGINYDPGNTAFNPNQDLPELAGVPTRDPNFRNRIIGDVNLADSKMRIDSTKVMGRRISLRADEGEPFNVGRINRMGDNTIFHALQESNIIIGNNVTFGAKSIVHGGGRPQVDINGEQEPTTIKDNVTLKSQAIIFRSLIGEGSTIGMKSLVVNSVLAPGTNIGDKIIYDNNTVFGQVEW